MSIQDPTLLLVKGLQEAPLVELLAAEHPSQRANDLYDLSKPKDVTQELHNLVRTNDVDLLLAVHHDLEAEVHVLATVGDRL